MWILGGIKQPDYSHVRDDVSSLLAVDAPNKKLFDKFIIASSILLLVFYLGVHWGVNNGVGSILGPVLFIVSGVMGVLVALFFPLDAGGEIVTTRGKMHLILVTVMGLLTLVGMVAMWMRLEAVAEWSMFATLSLSTAIISLILFIVAGIGVNSQYRGLLERFAVSTFQVYYFVFALMVFLMN